jgi:anaerobic dimethyl sulfoxide reductase subunit A
VALPWYKGHYYIHRPKVIEPLGESRTDFQVFTELAYRLEARPEAEGLRQALQPARHPRLLPQRPTRWTRPIWSAWWNGKVRPHQGVTMSWAEFKKHGVYKFTFKRPWWPSAIRSSRANPSKPTPARSRSSRPIWPSITDWTKTQYGYPIPPIPKWIEPFESLNHPKAKDYPFHLVTPHPRWRTHSIYPQHPVAARDLRPGSDPQRQRCPRLGIQTGDTVEVWNERGKCVVPAYVTERCLPGVAVLFEGAWMDLDENGVDRAGNPDFLTLDEPSPAGAFAYNTALVNIRKTELVHRPGWDQLATARSSVFRRDY